VVWSQPSGFTGGRYDFKISVKFGASTFTMYVAKRPGCDNFLRKAAENYELIIFTASVEPVSASSPFALSWRCLTGPACCLSVLHCCHG